jgi:RNA polymerase sigma factor (sigma-70 family)
MGDCDEPIPEDLVNQAREGDLAAYGELVRLTEGLVRGAVRREIRDTALAEDAVQETYLRAFRALRGLRDARAFAGWLRRVAVSTARNELRRRRWVFVDPLGLAEVAASRGEEAPPDDPVSTALSRALVKLSSEDRRLCERYYRGGWTTVRLARTEGASEPAIRKRLQRVRDRLRKDIAMTLETQLPNDLPERIIELLSRPRLMDLPESPVGAVWDAIRATRPDDEEVELPEMLNLAALEAVLGDDLRDRLPPHVHWADDERFLRPALTLPMLVAARERPVGARLLAAGKVFRDETVDASHLQAFHQAELLWIGEGLSPWAAMDWIADMVAQVLPDRGALGLEECAFPPYAEKGWDVSVRRDDRWVSIAGFAGLEPAIVGALGHDSERVQVVGVGLGLERIASLRYGIDDLRHIEASRIAGLAATGEELF